MKSLDQCIEPQLTHLNHARNGHSRSITLAVPTSPAPGSQAALPPTSLPDGSGSPPPASILKRRPRTGAVASLPKDERDMVCRMIDSGVPYKRILEALDQLGFEVTERNISNWVTHGGYAEWCVLSEAALQTSLRQDDLLEHHRHENSPDLAEVGLQAAAVRLSELLLRQAASSQDLEGKLSKLEPAINLLCRINKELFTLQKYRDDCQTKILHTPARIKAEERKKRLLCEVVYSAEPKPKPPGAPAPGASPIEATPASQPTDRTEDGSSPAGPAPQADPLPPAMATHPEPPKEPR